MQITLFGIKSLKSQGPFSLFWAPGSFVLKATYYASY